MATQKANHKSLDKRGVEAMTRSVTKGIMKLQAPGKGAKTNVVPAKKQK